MTKREERPGVAVDAKGGSVVDPTKNVEDLTNAAVRRQDDLRAAHEKYVESRLSHLNEINRIQDEHSKVIARNETERVDALRNCQLACVREVAELRDNNYKEIRHVETDRLNAVRMVDVGAVKTEAERALVAIQTLAAQTATDREKLRTDVATAATTIAKQFSETVLAINERLAALERAGSEAKGKEGVSDPRLAGLYEGMAKMNEYSSTVTGRGAGAGAMWGYVVAGIGLVVSLLTGVAVIFSLRGR